MSNLQKTFFAGTPKGVGQVCLKFPASAGRVVSQTIASLPALAGKLQTSNTLVQPFGVPAKNILLDNMDTVRCAPQLQLSRQCCKCRVSRVVVRAGHTPRDLSGAVNTRVPQC